MPITGSYATCVVGEQWWGYGNVQHGDVEHVTQVMDDGHASASKHDIHLSNDVMPHNKPIIYPHIQLRLGWLWMVQQQQQHNSVLVEYVAHLPVLMWKLLMGTWCVQMVGRMHAN